MMKSWSKRDAQRRIDSFFETTHAVGSGVGGRVAKFRSARLGAAVANLTNEASAAELFLPRGPAQHVLGEDVVIDYGDGQFGGVVNQSKGNEEFVPRLSLDDEDDDDLANLDLSQFSNPRDVSEAPDVAETPSPRALKRVKRSAAKEKRYEALLE
jgi:hypothetical protein